MSSNSNHSIRYPFWYGGFGGLCACIATHPLDLAKVRLQTSSIPKPTILQMAFTILQLEGVKGLYSGLSAAILRQGTYSLTRFGSYEFLKQRYISRDHETIWTLLPISMISGCLGGFVGNPSDVVNIRMQNDSSLPINQRRMYKNAIDGLIRIYEEEGFKSYFKGLNANLIRGILMNSSQVVSYDLSKKFLLTNFKMDKDSKGTFFVASLMAGVVATTVCSPADVLKTRIMNDKHHHSVFKVFEKSIKSEGVGFLFRGWIPSFIRLGPNTMIIFLVVEQLRKHKIGM